MGWQFRTFVRWFIGLAFSKMSQPDGEILLKLQTVVDGLFLDPPRLTHQTRATDVAEWDSLMQISILVAVEKEFGVRFRTGEVEATRNVGEFCALIRQRMVEP
jgi:acyl carrier protein